MSTPLPAMFVATVTAPNLPACAIICASCSWFFAFKTLCTIPLLVNCLDTSSEASTDTVPNNIGCPFLFLSIISSITAFSFASFVLYTASCWSILCIGRLVGISTTSRLYIWINSSSSVFAVPVIPAKFSYILK